MPEATLIEADEKGKILEAHGTCRLGDIVVAVFEQCPCRFQTETVSRKVCWERPAV